MIIIIGLGNPGEKYKNTPHNIGFEVVDYLAKENVFPEFKLSKKLDALISEKENVILAKPRTFMNNSGRSIKKIFENNPRSDLIVIHDDIDLPLGKIKISQNRGSAGHRGVASIIKELGTKNFTRVRIGIQPDKGKPENVEKYVIQKFKNRHLLKPIIEKAVLKIKDYGLNYC